MVEPIRICRDDGPAPLIPREWLITNGLGGFASATITGEITRRYHGLLIAALPPPYGRMVVFNDLDVGVEADRLPASPACKSTAALSISR